MKAIILDGFGAADVMRVSDMPMPVAAAGQIVVRVMATSVNRPDLVQRQGNYPPPKGDSEILGLDVAGVVESVGTDVTRWQPGDRVMALVGGGGYAEFALAYDDHVMPIPASLSFEQAACIPETYLTAYLNVFMLGGLDNEKSALIHGGGGGVNTAALHLVSVLAPSATTIVTASRHKCERVTELGATHVVNYEDTEFVDAVAELTGRQGVDVILDHIGRDYLASNLKSLAVNGRLVIIGVMSGIKAELNLALLMVKRQQILGSVLRSRSRQEKAELISSFTTTVLPFFADNAIAPLIHDVYTLDDVAKAHKAMEATSHFGKLVVNVGQVSTAAH